MSKHRSDPSPTSGGVHRALLYRGLDDFLAQTVLFVKEGLARGEPVMVAVAPDRMELLAEALGALAREVRFLDIRRLGANPARILPAWLGFIEEAGAGGGSLRGIGEPVWAERSTAALDECERHEALLNLVVAEHPSLQLLCPYDAAALSDEALTVAERTHGAEGRGLERARLSLEGELAEPEARAEELAFGPGQHQQVRARASAVARRAGLPPMRRADLEWAASELVENSVRHGGGRGRARIWEEAEGVVLEVSNRGQIENPMVGRQAPPERRGQGLWLVNQLCDLVQIRSALGATVVRIHVGREEGPREVGGLPLLAEQLTAALDRFSAEVERRLSRADRSILWRLSAGAEAALSALPEGGSKVEELAAALRAERAMLEELVSELAAAGLLVRSADSQLLPTARGRRLRRSLAAERRGVLEELLARAPASELGALLSGLEGLAQQP